VKPKRSEEPLSTSKGLPETRDKTLIDGYGSSEKDAYKESISNTKNRLKKTIDPGIKAIILVVALSALLSPFLANATRDSKGSLYLGFISLFIIVCIAAAVQRFKRHKKKKHCKHK
jgi:hypothetical protein